MPTKTCQMLTSGQVLTCGQSERRAGHSRHGTAETSPCYFSIRGETLTRSEVLTSGQMLASGQMLTGGERLTGGEMLPAVKC